MKFIFYTVIEKRWYSLISQSTPSNTGLHLEQSPVPKWHFSQFEGHGFVHCGTFATGLARATLKIHKLSGSLVLNKMYKRNTVHGIKLSKDIPKTCTSHKSAKALGE